MFASATHEGHRQPTISNNAFLFGVLSSVATGFTLDVFFHDTGYLVLSAQAFAARRTHVIAHESWW
ncbi:uncharacterized protein K452DRAFT_291048 [Aplosporella prunicola CBS 121167]|uniref:Uncharacterized protein n=1 Tax=Aplosporella prunicola CBS 121167 TaxID=1176127 RepID=A0A6A6B2G8_9PEZI|nr:uncharacterized protein K452DRAFT_291048 [Aplosporella prunicola CBS 121167]KAF2138016.1 hypothetical protein K452DRAFT_291048 [Aplosporella prunicola CBS 121167]